MSATARSTRGRSRRLFAIGAAAALATMEYAAATPARAAQFEFKCASINPPDDPSSVRLVQMWAEIEKESGGRIHTQFFPAGALGNDASVLSQLRLGAVQFLMTSAGNLSSVIPAFDLVPLGFAYKDPEEALHVMDGPLGAYLRTETAAKGLYALRSMGDGGMFVIGSTSHPIRTPDDLRGYKIRVTSSRITVDLFKALGAITTPLSFGEVYTSLQTKIIDGEASPMVTIENGRFYEINRYLSLTNHAWAGIVLLANADVWKALPPDLQDLVERSNTRFSLLERRDMKAAETSMASQLGRQGLAVNPVDQTPFRQQLRGYYESWASEFGPTAWGLLQTSLGRKLF